MALGRKVIDTLRFVYSRDPAIDQEKSDLENYLKFFEEKYLKYIDGKKPTIFTIKQLKIEQRIAKDEFSNDLQKHIFILRCGLIGIDNFVIENADGTLGLLNGITRKDEGALGSLITDDWIKESNISEEYIGAIAGAIMRITEAHPFL